MKIDAVRLIHPAYAPPGEDAILVDYQKPAPFPTRGTRTVAERRAGVWVACASADDLAEVLAHLAVNRGYRVDLTPDPILVPRGDLLPVSYTFSKEGRVLPPCLSDVDGSHGPPGGDLPWAIVDARAAGRLITGPLQVVAGQAITFCVYGLGVRVQPYLLFSPFSPGPRP